jgi:hypothetical protein
MKSGIRWFAGIVGLAALLVSSVAQALQPVTKEQLLCSGPYIFTGRVLSAVNKDCRLTKSAAECSKAQKNNVQLEVVITRILGVRPELANPTVALRVGQTIRPMTEAQVSPYYNEVYDDWSGPNFKGPYDSILSDEQVNAAYVGRELLFSGGPSVVRTWNLDGVRWARETMRSGTQMPERSSCHTPL